MPNYEKGALERMRKFLLVLLAGALIASGAVSARALTLADLLVPGATLQVGDKLFGDFTYASNSVGWLGANPANIGVMGLFLGGDPEQPGIQFSGPLTIGGLAPQNADGTVTYTVTVTNPNAHIFEIVNRIAGAGVIIQGAGLAVGSVAETATDVFNPMNSVNSVTYVSNRGSHVVDVQPIIATKLSISKNIALNIIGNPGTVTYGLVDLSSVEQYFHETTQVPEPGTLALLIGLGVSGSLFGFRMRRR